MLLPHLPAGYNLARWLVRSAHDAEDLVQEAYLRAFRSFDGYRGGDPRTWLLKIVRNTCYTWLRQRRADAVDQAIDDVLGDVPADPAVDPEAEMIRRMNGVLVREALETVPVEFREALILRELEGLSYKEIAEIADVPLGTVMSRLARGRQRLQEALLRGPGGSER